MKAILTRQWNKAFSLLRYEPIMETVAGTDHKDVYVCPGDPVGYRNMCEASVTALLGSVHPELAGVGDSIEVEAFMIPLENMTRELRTLIREAQQKKENINDRCKLTGSD